MIVGSAFTAALYKRQTKVVEGANAEALSRMSSVASQAFYGIRTVRWEAVCSGGFQGLGFSADSCALDREDRGRPIPSPFPGLALDQLMRVSGFRIQDFKIQGFPADSCSLDREDVLVPHPSLDYL